MTQIVSWDEKHSKVVFDGLKAHSAHARRAVRFKRDPDAPLTEDGACFIVSAVPDRMTAESASCGLFCKRFEIAF